MSIFIATDSPLSVHFMPESPMETISMLEDFQERTTLKTRRLMMACYEFGRLSSNAECNTICRRALTDANYILRKTARTNYRSRGRGRRGRQRNNQNFQKPE
eukprot:GHVP01053326.1.p1 GENE.GHVP01053326.1~~GHVP01053326.1.p1  ORF type:complete len:110 (+),score=2.37 GHVP01053326.1:26-331(+)